MHRAIPLLLLLSWATVDAAPVSVDSSALGPGTEGRTGIGLTVSSTTRPYAGIGTQVATLPYLSWNSGNLYVSGLNLGYVINPGSHYRFDLTAVPRFLGYKERDSESLEGLDDAGYSIHGGLSLSTTAGPLGLNALLLSDLLGISGGTELIGSASRTFSLGRLSLTPTLSVGWQDRALIDFYYGVSAADATAERAAYAADAAVSTAVSLTAGYPVSPFLSVIGTLRYDRYGKEIEDSPLVESGDSTAVSVGLVYLFPVRGTPPRSSWAPNAAAESER